jgi:hypothetical protein
MIGIQKLLDNWKDVFRLHINFTGTHGVQSILMFKKIGLQKYRSFA